MAGETPVKITVLGLNGDALVTRQVPSSHTVHCVKEDLARTMGYPISVIKLFYDAEELPDDSSFSPPPVEILLSAVFTVDPNGSGLQDAARDGFHGQVRAILCVTPDDSRKARLTSNVGGNGALHLAAQQGHVEVTRVLMSLAAEEGVRREVLTTLNEFDDTALHFAASYGHTAVTRVLVEAASAEGVVRDLLEERNPHGDTALHVCGDNSKVAQVLIDAAAHEHLLSDFMNTRNDDGDTALHVAADQDNAMVLATLLDAATAEGILQEFLTSRNDDRATALHYAALKGHASVVNTLISAAATFEESAFLSVCDCNSQTAREVAAQRGHKAVVQLLPETQAAAVELVPGNAEVTETKIISVPKKKEQLLPPAETLLLPMELPTDELVVPAGKSKEVKEAKAAPVKAGKERSPRPKEKSPRPREKELKGSREKESRRRDSNSSSDPMSMPGSVRSAQLGSAREGGRTRI